MEKYKIIYADPAWSYDDKSLNRGGAERHYRTMSVEDIKNLQVEQLADEDCALFMWATFPKLQEALDVIKAWGFEYKTNAFVWVKRNKVADSLFWGMGRWTRSNAEVCLFAVKGKPQRVGKGVHSVIESPIDVHSKKPAETRERIVELMGDVSRVELFARQKIEGWDSWGNEVLSDVDLSGVKKFNIEDYL